MFIEQLFIRQYGLPQKDSHSTITHKNQELHEISSRLLTVQFSRCRDPLIY